MIYSYVVGTQPRSLANAWLPGIVTFKLERLGALTVGGGGFNAMLGDPKTKKCSCCQIVDGQLIEIDLIFSTRDLHVLLVMDKYEHSMPVALGHRCVHCPLQSCVGKRKKWKRRISFKNRRPQLDCDHAPTQYQNHILQQLQTTSRATADTMETIFGGGGSFLK